MIYRIFVIGVFVFLIVTPVLAQRADVPSDQLLSTQEVIPQVLGTEESFQSTGVKVSPPAYALPYPGLLVDHPLYFLKKVRDGLLESLIVDPIKKTEFYLLQSDKFLAMAQIFSTSKRSEKTSSIVEASLTSFGNAQKSAMKLKESGSLPGYLEDKLMHSAQKRVEIISQLSILLPQQQWASLSQQANQFAADTLH